MREFAKDFYNSKAWKDTRRAYASSVGGLCERCLSKGIYRPGTVVHHKIHLSPENIGDPSITLAWSNLLLVCADCHADIHAEREHRYRVGRDGKIISSW